MGGWVGWVEGNEAVRTRYCELGFWGGWVGGPTSLISSLKPVSKTDMAAREPEPMVT